MPQDFIQLADGFYVSPQITPADIKKAGALGITTIINNRPDHEEAGQPLGEEIEKAAKDAGMTYIAIPISHGGITDEDLIRFDEAVASAGPVLGFCRTGTRSTILRAVAAARSGRDVSEIIAEAATAGYDLSAQRAMLEGLT